MAISQCDIGVPIDFECGEDISDAETMELKLFHERTSTSKSFTAALKPASSTAIRYTTQDATDIPEKGVWQAQARIVQPGSVDRRTTIALFEATAKI